MAWPYDARLTEFSAGTQVPSATLNAIQDRIVDLFATNAFVDVEAYPEVGAAYPNWAHDWINPARGWTCIDEKANSQIAFCIRARSGMVVTGIDVKYYNGSGIDTADNTFTLYKPDCNFDSASTAPSLGSAIATNTDATAALTWAVRSMGTLSVTVAAGERLLLILDHAMSDGDPGVGDFYAIAGIQVTARPLTASS
jgi:hypothetical protein